VPEGVLLRQQVDPLGSFDPLVSPPLGIAAGVAAVLAVTALLELSRTLAEAYRGRWFAGNGRDLFHAAAVVAMAFALLLCGLPPALACVAAATVLVLPLLLLDSLPPHRPRRVAFLLALVGIAAAPAILEPRSIVEAVSAVARAFFPH
jgi:hypothetical protein